MDKSSFQRKNIIVRKNTYKYTQITYIRWNYHFEPKSKVVKTEFWNINPPVISRMGWNIDSGSKEAIERVLNESLDFQNGN